MRGHPNAILALAVTLDVQTKFLHSFIVEFQPILTFEKAIVTAVWTHLTAVLAVAST